ncbi:MAG TPA: type II toxin-antitoxin system VapC family toxin [Thermoanaerobaculia bacterium]|nr:type II toxin-antitoxin system VapC family toxin [Thermoanaerobaculia bacterium]
MNSYVVDASVVVKWFLPEPYAEAAARLKRPDLDLHAPELLVLEVSNALWKHSRRGALDPAVAQEAVEALAVAPIRWHGLPSLFADAFRIASETSRSVYDCSYLALSIRLQQLTVTADRRFFDAIQTGPYASQLLWVEDIPLPPARP